ncbi:MAG TPA: Crp/Fnr family transcriptional regulator [Alphaproteobacteria bacterium]|nr:Crp/Fnr family transcriptional regulator [Alphaproteobacteria bacterium]
MTPLLRKLEAFGPLSGRDAALIDEVGRQRRPVPAQTLLVAEADPAPGAFLIHAGWTVRYRLLADGRRQILEVLLPGDIAVVHLPPHGPADHSILTVTAAAVAPVAPERLMALMREETPLGAALWSSAAWDRALLRERVVSIGRRSAYERTAHLLLELWHRLDMVGFADGNTFGFPLTQLILADALGLSIVHVNRTLRRLQEDGLVRQSARSMTILDAAKLAAVAEFDEARLRPLPPLRPAVPALADAGRLH